MKHAFEETLEITEAKREIKNNPYAAYRVVLEESWGLKGFYDPLTDRLTRARPALVLMENGVACMKLQWPKNRPKPFNLFGNIAWSGKELF